MDHGGWTDFWYCVGVMANGNKDTAIDGGNKGRAVDQTWGCYYYDYLYIKHLAHSYCRQRAVHVSYDYPLWYAYRSSLLELMLCAFP